MCRSTVAVQALLRAGADPNLRDGSGFLPLSQVAWVHVPTLGGLLLDAGAHRSLSGVLGAWMSQWADRARADLEPMLPFFLERAGSPLWREAWTEKKGGTPSNRTHLNGNTAWPEGTKALREHLQRSWQEQDLQAATSRAARGPSSRSRL